MPSDEDNNVVVSIDETDIMFTEPVDEAAIVEAIENTIGIESEDIIIAIESEDMESINVEASAFTAESPENPEILTGMSDMEIMAEKMAGLFIQDMAGMGSDGFASYGSAVSDTYCSTPVELWVQ